MSGVVRVVAVAVLLGGGAVAGCGGGDDDDAAAVDVTATTRERSLTVCGVEEEADHVNAAATAAGDWAGQRESAIAFLDEIIAIRAKGRPPTEIAADFASVTKAYEVVRDGFEAAASPDDYLTKVVAGADAAFGGAAEVDRFEAAYTAWVVENCGFDPQLGIALYPEG